MNSSQSLDTLSLISIQHELAMNISSHHKLLPMVRRVMSICLRRLAIRRVRLFLRQEAYGVPNGASQGPGGSCYLAMPLAEPKQDRGQSEIMAWIETRFLAGGDDIQARSFQEGQLHCHLFPLASEGLIVLERAAEPLPDVLVDALVPVFANLSKACRATREHELVVEEVERRRSAEKRIEYLAFHDDLSGLPNRRKLLQSIQQRSSGEGCGGCYSVLLYLGLDNFSDINDSLGYAIGDAVLGQIAGRLAEGAHGEVRAARVEGDEFALFYANIADTEAAARQTASESARALMELVALPSTMEGRELTVATSIGAVLCNGSEIPADTILSRGRMALRRAKSLGRHTLHFYDNAMSRQVEQRLNLDLQMRTALQASQFSLYLQPQVDANGRPIGAESLIRWRHPERGMISPMDFIPMAEQSGFIIPLSNWVLEQACDMVLTLEGQGFLSGQGHLAVNLSAKQFHQPDFVSRVKQTVERSGILPQHLELELTEGTLLDGVEETIDKMQQLKALGIRFSIDDFGTGYSSLSYIRDLPLDRLKIDRAFVKGIHESADNAVMVEMILSLAGQFGFQVIAEGVESVEEAKALKALGCSEFQGYLYGRPMPFEQLRPWWEKALA